MSVSNKVKESWIATLWSQVRDRGPRRMRVAESLMLGGRRSLVLVECDGQEFLVGCGPDQVSCVVALPPGREGLAVVPPRQARGGAPE